MNKKVVSIITIVSMLFVVSCAGHAPELVNAYQYGDEKRSCAGLQSEMADIDSEVVRLASERSTKILINTLCAVSGIWLLVPWFFIDAKSDENAEIRALKKRKNALRGIAVDKGCDPSVEKTEDTAIESEEKPLGSIGEFGSAHNSMLW